MIDELARWNGKRVTAGRSPIKVAVSGNYGTAVLGDIGTRDSMTFTAIGDTLNIASRMQGLCRSLDSQLVVSQSLARRASEESGGEMPVLSRLMGAGTGYVALRSRFRCERATKIVAFSLSWILART